MNISFIETKSSLSILSLVFWKASVLPRCGVSCTVKKPVSIYPSIQRSRPAVAVDTSRICWWWLLWYSSCSGLLFGCLMRNELPSICWRKTRNSQRSIRTTVDFPLKSIYKAASHKLICHVVGITSGLGSRWRYLKYTQLQYGACMFGYNLGVIGGIIHTYTVVVQSVRQ